MGDRAQELKVREENGDVSAGLVADVFLASTNPFDGSAITKSTVDLFYFLPCGELLSTSAQGFGQIRGEAIANSTRCYKTMIHHIFFQAGVITGGEEDGHPMQYVTWTVVPSAANAKGYAGYLFRVVYTIPEADVMGPIDQHVQSCTAKAATAMRKGRSLDRLAVFQRTTRSEWINMCDFYLSGTRSYEERSKGFKMLDSLQNPYYPGSIFSVDNAIKKMKTSLAVPEFCHRSAWIGAGGAITFPYGGARTYLLLADQLKVTVIDRTRLPHLGRSDATLDNEEFCNFARGAGMNVPGFNQSDAAVEAAAAGLADMDIDSEAGGDAAGVQLEDVRKAFEQLTNSGDPESCTTLIAWKTRAQKRMSRARKDAHGDLELEAKLRREAQMDCIGWFFTDVFTGDATSDVGDSVHALADHFKDFLRKNANFMMPNDKYTKNLSRLGDTYAQEAALGDTVWAIHTAHQEVASLRLSSLHVYFYSPFHAHVCLLGAPGSGKSKSFQINNDRLIVSTTRDIGVETGKAKMTPGKKTDLAIETYEDIAPSQVGVSNQVTNANGKAAATSNTDAESMLKYRLTKGRMKGVYKAVVNGVHTMVEVDSFCNTVMLIGMNAILSQIPKSISNRFNCIQFSSRERMDSNGVLQGTSSKFAHGQNRHMTPVRNSALRRDMRNQIFHAIIQLLQWGGVFILNMAVPWLIWSKVLAKAKLKGLQDTDEVRHFERLQFHGETLVVADAIGRVLDSGPESPLDITKPFKIEDILHIEKHLYGNTEHAAFALGMFQHQWENPIIQAVEKFFKKVMLKNLMRDKASGRMPPQVENLRASSESAVGGSAAAASAPVASTKSLDAHYYIVSIDGLQVPSGLPDQLRLAQNIQRLQRYCSRLMMPRPQADEITNALECLASLQVEVDDQSKISSESKKKISIPVLMFSSNGEVMVSVQHMTNYTSNRMQTCLTEVLSHKYTKEKNFLYGKTKEKNPNIYQTIRIHPNPNNKLVMEQPSFFSASVLKMTHNAIKGVSASAYDRKSDELQEEEVMEDVFHGFFSDSAHKDVDMDLDDWASKKQCDEIGLRYFPPTRDAPGYDTTPDAIMKAMLARLSEQEVANLEIYPLCMKELSSVLYKQQILADKAANPAKYSLRATVDISHKRKMQEDANKENFPPSAAASAAPAAAALPMVEEEDDGACNVDFFQSDQEEDDDEDEDISEEANDILQIPPPEIMLHGGPNGGVLPQAWNNGPRTHDHVWDRALSNAQEASAAGIYQALPVGVSPAQPSNFKRQRTFRDDEDIWA